MGLGEVLGPKLAKVPSWRLSSCPQPLLTGHLSPPLTPGQAGFFSSLGPPGLKGLILMCLSKPGVAVCKSIHFHKLLN